MAVPQQVIDWLLEINNPPVRYLTLTNLLRRPPESHEVRKAKSRLMQYEVTQGILRRGEEFWHDDDRAYWKYTGKYWQLIFLGHFLADRRDPRIRDGVNGILQMRGWVSKSGGQCLTANLLAALMRLGYGDHPIVKEETEALASRILLEGGICCKAMDYSLLLRCHMAQPKLLLCFAQVPPEQRSREVTSAIELIVKDLLRNEVFVYVSGHQKQWQEILARQPKKADLASGQTVLAWIQDQRDRFLKSRGLGQRCPKQGWIKFGFPLHYNSDILEAMYALAVLGVPMTGHLERPLRIIRDKMTAEGTWILENSLNGKMLVDVEEKGRPSKWLSYFGHCVLSHFAGE
jgi:hypothetical protein